MEVYTKMDCDREEAAIRPYDCEICGLKFKQIGILKTHKKTIHGVFDPDLVKSRWNFCERSDSYGAASNIGKDLKIDLERKHACDICGCGFAMPGTLKMHIRKMHDAQDVTPHKSVKQEYIERSEANKHNENQAEESESDDSTWSSGSSSNEAESGVYRLRQ
ncbi:hypothetical protein PRIPAC_87398 [Pristionchus pacificus]|uniref:Zinc finger protein n=1 Tax=Pristionchus pacificus TaxID=54126 RepID=A0A2A6CYN4_PRIPA|nr:hypothetical protein PRIPAC_87398 [Pristionchus pacificus]|eukprot:PDM83133.1 zinc finger protein [Pristionchus pacificus]